MEKPGAAFTTRFTCTECAKLVPMAPEIVSVYVPAGVEVVVLTVTVEEPPTDTDVGLKVAVAPVGSPVTVNALTVPVPPSDAVVATVNVVLFPCVTVCEAGVADNSHPGKTIGRYMNVP